METKALLQHTAESAQAGVKAVSEQLNEVDDKVDVAIEGALSDSATQMPCKPI